MMINQRDALQADAESSTLSINTAMASLLAYNSMIMMGQLKNAQRPTSKNASKILPCVIPPKVIATIAIIMPWTHAPTPPGRSSRLPTTRWYGASQTIRPSVSSAPGKIIHLCHVGGAALQPHPSGFLLLVFRVESLCANTTPICIPLRWNSQD